jgi:hypothetical protein
MTRDQDDPRLDDATLRALRASGDLVPTTEAEVERAEGLLPELALPERLLDYQPRPLLVGEPRRARAKPLSYVAAAALGALAAAAALLWLRAPAPPRVTSAGAELVRPSVSASEPAPVPLVYQSRCERECCAGSDCKAAPAAAATCPSGLRCVSCATDNVTGGPYRLRVGAVILSDAGQKLLPPAAPLELCVLTSASETLCVPALGETNGDAWRLLKAVTPLQGLLTGLSVELRKRGEATALASWKHAVSPTPDVMCKGLAIQLNDGAETLGRLSAFIELTHFVELARASAMPELLRAARGFAVSGLRPRIYESSRPGAERFALVLGPLDKTDAEALRWQVLDRGLEANVSHGLDFSGGPRPVE